MPTDPPGYDSFTRNNHSTSYITTHWLSCNPAKTKRENQPVTVDFVIFWILYPDSHPTLAVLGHAPGGLKHWIPKPSDRNSRVSHDNVNKWKHLTGPFVRVTGEFPTQRPVTRNFDVFFDLRLNKQLSKQSRGWWFETPSRPLWRHCNAYIGTQFDGCLGGYAVEDQPSLKTMRMITSDFSHFTISLQKSSCSVLPVCEFPS